MLRLALILVLSIPVSSLLADEWLAPRGYNVVVDSDGYEYPTSIAIPARPSRVRYFVAELRGRIKAVLDDGSFEIVAGDLHPLSPRHELPHLKGEMGLGSICIDDTSRYLFATFSRPDEGGILRNGIYRYRIVPADQGYLKFDKDVGSLFTNDRSDTAHQIGQCIAEKERLYLGTGDGNQHDQITNPDATLGKVFVLDYEGAPIKKPAFIASGLRNPFGLARVEGDIFVADNGPNIDRLIKLQPGADYHWRGSDWSAGLKAISVFYPAIGPAHLLYLDSPSFLEKRHQRSFFIASSANSRFEKVALKYPGIVRIAYDSIEKDVTGAPEFFIRLRKSRLQSVVALAHDKEALYFSALYPPTDDSSGAKIYRVTHDPDANYEHWLASDTDPGYLMQKYACLGCHRHNGAGTKIGPDLDRSVLLASLEPRLAASGRTAKEHLIRHLLNPRADNPEAAMPDLGLQKPEADALAEFLLRDTGPTRWQKQWRRLGIVPFNSDIFFGELAKAAIIIWLLWRLYRYIRSRRESNA